ncbi:MAG: 30S ribosomal protein S16 [Candidatus Cloacimonetes bacterium]|nr:30S ribosomal protein S16 [Candidatus Cloacimonadota bacterium]
MVKLRLTRMGANNKPFYRIVAIDSRKKRDGRYLDNIGYYDPKTDPHTLEIKADLAIKWLKLGAQPTDTVRSLFKQKGIMEQWHKMRYTVEKVAEEADEEPVDEAVAEEIATEEGE